MALRICAFSGRGAAFLLALLLALLLAAAVAACGGAGEVSVNEFEILDFGPDDPADDLEYQLQLAREAAAAGLTFEPERLVEVSVVYGNQVRLELLQEVNKDLEDLVSYGSPAEVDLNWVIDVHQAVEDADRRFEEAVGYRLPDDQLPAGGAETYLEYYVELLETLQLAGYGASRLLAAAVLIGPDGRTLLNLDEAERVRFDILVREAKFYLGESSLAYKDLSERLSEFEGGLGER